MKCKDSKVFQILSHLKQHTLKTGMFEDIDFFYHLYENILRLCVNREREGEGDRVGKKEREKRNRERKERQRQRERERGGKREREKQTDKAVKTKQV